MKVPIWIGVGGNLPGTKEAAYRAFHALRNILLEISISPVFRTPAWGNPFQPPFWNWVVRGWTYWSVREVLDVLQMLERRAGRRREERWGPRILDLDLLLYGDRVIRMPDLRVPHPLMTRRTFVLDPALTLGNPLHPETGQTFRWHRERV